MKTLKLQVGKTYRSREGEEVKIVEKYWILLGINSTGRYLYKGSNGGWYTESGNLWYREHPGDLIEEVPSEPTR